MRRGRCNALLCRPRQKSVGHHHGAGLVNYAAAVLLLPLFFCFWADT
jgi:hypothetical protein